MADLKINLSSIKQMFSSEEMTKKYIEKEKNSSFSLPAHFKDDLFHEIIKGMDVYHTKKAQEAIVYIPGGGFISDPSDYQLRFAREMGASTKQTVYCLIYPKTPNYGRDEIVHKVKEVVHALCKEYSGVSLVSDSAGSAIALSVMDELDVNYKRVVFLSPLVDLRYDSDAQEELEKEDEMLAFPGVRMLADLYRNHYKADNPLVSPVLLRKLKKVPSLIIVGKKEMMLHDARLLKEKYETLQIKYIYHEVDDMMHDFVFYPIEEGEKYRKEVFTFLQK